MVFFHFESNSYDTDMTEELMPVQKSVIVGLKSHQ